MIWCNLSTGFCDVPSITNVICRDVVKGGATPCKQQPYIPGRFIEVADYTEEDCWYVGEWHNQV